MEPPSSGGIRAPLRATGRFELVRLWHQFTINFFCSKAVMTGISTQNRVVAMRQRTGAVKVDIKTNGHNLPRKIW